MTYPEILAFAMNKEKAAFRFYTALAWSAKKLELKEAFSKLAQEEANHNRLEIEYDWETS